MGGILRQGNIIPKMTYNCNCYRTTPIKKNKKKNRAAVTEIEVTTE